MSTSRSSAERPTLAPRLSRAGQRLASAFHAALSEFNEQYGTHVTFEEMTTSQQDEVRALARVIHRERHPLC
jgi:hypothetical protein